MSHAQLHADVHVTIAMWRRQRLPATTIWLALGNQTGRRVKWNTVRTFMLGWLAAREQLSLQRVG